jgi:hypothetical protein
MAVSASTQLALNSFKNNDEKHVNKAGFRLLCVEHFLLPR